jgi:K(+)-stimulated pyrophosphate-energized sodium pump
MLTSWRNRFGTALAALIAGVLGPASAFAGEADLILPDLASQKFLGDMPGTTLLTIGLGICVLGALFGLVILSQLKKAPVHKSMAEISELIYETCKTYLQTQGKFIMVLWVFIAAVIAVYFGVLEHKSVGTVAIILIFSPDRHRRQLRRRLVRHPREHLRQLAARPSRPCAGKPWPTYAIPLKAGMSIGMLLISTELVMMLAILLFVPKDSPAPASSASPSVSPSAPRRSASPAASSRRSPTSGRT